MYLRVGEGVPAFNNDGWMAAVTVCCSDILLRLLHCLGIFVKCSWTKVKDVSLQVGALALEVSI